MSKSGVYAIVNIYNGKVYVGSSKNMERRKKDHFRYLNENRHHNIHLQNAYNLYGSDSIFFFILEHCEPDKILKVEQEYLDLLEVCNPDYGYNISPKTTGGAICGEKNYFYGKHFFGEQNAMYGKKRPDLSERNKLNSKKVLQFKLDGEFVNEFPALIEAERQTGIANNSISKVCQGKRKSAGGYLWRYAA